jgi:hypothetical protein
MPEKEKKNCVQQRANRTSGGGTGRFPSDGCCGSFMYVVVWMVTWVMRDRRGLTVKKKRDDVAGRPVTGDLKHKMSR